MNTLPDRGVARSPSVAAVVVTRNRLALLQACLAAIRAQTRKPDEIIVVDNDSTDGTADWLPQQADVTSVRQANLGGAGGFHRGMEEAYRRGHDWAWCMDDDGYPAHDCLQRLATPHPSGVLFRSPMVLDRDDHESLAFQLDTGGRLLRTRAEALAEAREGLIMNAASAFNGVLCHRELAAKIGLPKAELFLWGDETEYLRRTQAAGLPIATNVTALFYHPRNRIALRTFLFMRRELTVAHVGNPLKDYLIVRNEAYINRTYFGWWRCLKGAGRHVLFRWKHESLLAGLRAMGYAVQGATGRLEGHRAFLRETQGPK